jgi:hypothetical protein
MPPFAFPVTSMGVSGLYLPVGIDRSGYPLQSFPDASLGKVFPLLSLTQEFPGYCAGEKSFGNFTSTFSMFYIL